MRFLAALIALAVTCLAQPSREESQRVFAEINENLQELSRLSGFKVRKQVRYDLITRDQVSKFLRTRIKEKAKPEQIRAEELTLKKFGLVPPDFSLEKSTVDLLTEQAAAFYDFESKKLYITDWASSGMQQSALAHELAHALADQNFHLKRFLESSKNDDAELARMAVMEGQASWLMSEYFARKSGQSLKTSPVLLDAMSQSAEGGAGEYPVFEQAPLYMRETLLFPYTWGIRFQQALVVKMGVAAFAEVFRKPPASTQQILHPEKYFAGVVSGKLSPPDLVSRRGFKVLAEGTVGELDHQVLLRQYAGKADADKVAPHWTGGSYRLLENRKLKRLVLAYASEWDEAASAKEYFELYRKVLDGKWKKTEFESTTADYISGRGDDGFFLVRLRGRVVTSLEGLEALSQAR